MDVMNAAAWWIVGLVLASFTSVFVALARCAIAEFVVRAAARLHTSDEQLRADLVEEWLRVLADMRPSERPAHAATLLWAGLKLRPVWVLRDRQVRVDFSVMAQRGAFTLSDRDWGRMRLWWWKVKFTLRPMPIDVITEVLTKVLDRYQAARAELDVLKAHEASAAADDPTRRRRAER
jgi:hypothetical protein